MGLESELENSQIEMDLSGENHFPAKPKIIKKGKGRTGVRLKRRMTYEEARRIKSEFNTSGPYLVGLATLYVDSRQLPRVDNPRSMSHEDYYSYRHLGHVVLGVANGIVNSQHK